MNINLLTFIRITLSLVGIGLAFGAYLYLGSERPWRRRIYVGTLTVVAVLSLYTYLEVGPQFRHTTAEAVMNPHDFYHYYVGPKYSRELGYFDLYECTVVADRETTRRIRDEWSIRDLRTLGITKASLIGNPPERCKALFTPKRWIEFTRDVQQISMTMAPSRWNEVLRDKGYNATPVWNRFAAVLTNLVSIRSRAGLWGLLVIDYAYTLAAFIIVGATFGARNALLVVAFWGLNFVTAPGFVKGSVSRLDWLLALVAAYCLLRRGRPVWAGVLAGISTALRLFPVLFCFGLACKAVWVLLRTRRLPQPQLRFFAAFAVSCGLLFGLTALTAQDRSRWGDFAAKISIHDQQVAGYRVGLKYVLLEPGNYNRTQAQRQIDAKRSMAWLSQGLAFIAVFFASRRLADHQTLGASFPLIFFLTAPTFYYYQMLVIPFMLFLPDPREPVRAIGMGGFFAWCVTCYALNLMYPLGMTLSHWVSWTLIALCALTLGVALALSGEESRARLPSAAEAGG